MPEPRIVATAGHIDHGKSTLVEALTGTNPDRLPEEQKRGMTIELGFACLDMPDPQAVGGGWHIGIVDVPGHADFVRNMVAGVGCIDAAILTIAADDGWMPQTEEHFQILLYLGVRHGLIALTKSDLLADPAPAIEDIRRHLRGTPWEPAPVIPVCALDGSGLDSLKASICQVLRQSPPPRDHGKPRLFVDRVFSPRGAGTVVTGTLTGGRFHPGDEIMVQPAGLRGKIRALQNHGQAAASARPGMRTAIQLSGIDMAANGEGSGVWRGHVIEGGDLLHPHASSVIHLWLERTDRTGTDATGSDGPHRRSGKARALRHGQKVWFHHGSSGSEARLYLAGPRHMEPGQSAVAELRFVSPVAVQAGDRFVIRDFSRRHTLAGGMVLEPIATPRAWKNPRYLASMQERAARPADADTWVRDLLDRDGSLRSDGLLRWSHFSSADITAALTNLAGTTVRGGWIIAPERWQQAITTAADAVRAWHKAHAQEQGMPLPALRGATAASLPDNSLTNSLIDDLTAAGFVRTKDTIRAPEFKPALPPEVRRACLALRGVLFADKQNPPGIASYVKTPDEKAALRAMIQSGELFMLDADTAMLTTGYEELKSRIIAALTAAGRATMAAIRDATGSTRRILVPVCERMDRERLTIRDGDFRRAASPVRSP